MAHPPLVPSVAAPHRTHFYGHRDAVFEVTLHEPAADLRALPEALVHDLWHHQQFCRQRLFTTTGMPVTVLHPGAPNPDSGPDFRNVHLRIDETQWRGDVEIHVTSSGWFEHEHHLDARYDSVVLHVTLCADGWTGGLLRADGSTVPEVILYPQLEAPLRALLYQFRTAGDDDLPCASWWGDVPEATRTTYLDALANERVSAKTQRLAERYLTTPDLDALLHERLFAGLGYAKNSDPMTMLARRLPLRLLHRVDDPRDVEALHLGVAGLLPEPADLLEADRATADYVMDLRHRFERWQHRHTLAPLESTQWRFFRMRPANFPPLRVAQAAGLTAPGGLLRRNPMSQIIRALQAQDHLDALRRLFDADLSPFWETHVRLASTTKPRSPAIGQPRRNALLINAVAPLLLLHADQTGQVALEEATVALLKDLPPERNHVVRRYRDLGTRAGNAFESQGLLHLHATRCTEGHCLTCPIGRHLLDGSG